jgi:hypothetical protein
LGNGPLSNFVLFFIMMKNGVGVKYIKNI